MVMGRLLRGRLPSIMFQVQDCAASQVPRDTALDRMVNIAYLFCATSEQRETQPWICAT